MGRFSKCLKCSASKTTEKKSNNLESASKHNISTKSSKSNTHSFCSIFSCISKKPKKSTARKRRRYRASKRTIELAKPKKPRKKYQPPRFRYSKQPTTKPKSIKISKRTEELSLPYVRTLLAAKRDYGSVLRKKRRRLLDHHVDKSLKTSYSKMSHVIDTRKKKSICSFFSRKKSAKTYKITRRQSDMALPYTRILLSAKRDYKEVLDDQKYGNLNKHLQKSSRCLYSKMWHVKPPKPRRSSCFSICRSKSKDKIFKRYIELALPRVRILKDAKLEFKSVLGMDKLKIFDKHIESSLGTRYSRLAKVKLPEKRLPKEKWTPEERRRHEEWMEKLAKPKRDFSEFNLVL